MLDGVDDPAKAQELMVVDRKVSLIIVSTRSSRVAQKMAANGACIFNLPGFTLKEAETLYQRLWGEISPETRHAIGSLITLTWGNQAVIQSAFHFADRFGWDVLLQLLHPTENIPPSLAVDFHAPLSIAYEGLPGDVQTRFHQLGKLPQNTGFEVRDFVKLWKLPLVQTRYYLDILETDAGIVRIYPGDESNRWKIHPQLRDFLQNLTKQ